MTEPMSVRSALCFPCDSEYCVFAQEGECRLPLVTGKLPVMTEEDGCLASIPKDDGWQDDAQETVAERVAYLFSCISKTLENAPKESKIWGTGGTHIHCDHSSMADGLSFFFNMLAENQVIQTLGSTAYLSPFNVKLRREREAGDPKAIWSELCDIAKAAKERYTDGAEAPVWSDGDMFFFKNIFANTIGKVADMGNFPEDVVNAFADLMDAIGLGPCATGYYDPKDDVESGEVCETTGCYYVDI